MTTRMEFIPALLLILLTVSPCAAGDKHNKNDVNRGMLERMEAVPCGAKQRGLTGLGSVFASAGIEAVNSEEKLCPQYLLRSDEMEYHIRPADKKHAVLLPVGHEGEFKIKKNFMYLRVPDGDKKKRAYQVVSMNPLSAATDAAASKPADKPAQHRPPEQPVEKASGALNPATSPPPQR